MRRFVMPVLLLVILLTASATLAQTTNPTPEETPEATPAVTETSAEPEILVPQVIASYPHATDAYTEGLVFDNGILYESIGKRGESAVRRVNLETGEVLQQTDMAPEYFGEGLALVDNRLIQLTWTAETAFVYDRDSLEQTGTFSYTGEGEGWGMCYDGASLYMSNGSDTITRRDPETFAALDTVQVLLLGEPISNFAMRGQRLDLINELECVGDDIYANLWQTDIIIRFNKTTGVINALIDASVLLTQEERVRIMSADSDNVLNGIAYDPENEVFYLTGKRWPTIFQVVLVPYEGR